VTDPSGDSLEEVRRRAAAAGLDARGVPGLAPSLTALVHGQAADGSIAATSILADPHRDAFMVRLHERDPV